MTVLLLFEKQTVLSFNAVLDKGTTGTIF